MMAIAGLLHALGGYRRVEVGPNRRSNQDLKSAGGLQSSFCAEGFRREAEGPDKCATHAFAICKTRFFCDDVTRVPPVLHHESGSLQPKLFNSFCRPCR
jgi:hypothetical protein